jgi:hypothetical protein
MNERIKELLTPKLKEWGGASGDNFSEELEKFAELIVQECASMARVFQSNEYDFTGDLDLDEFMLKHFGVEQ